MLELVQKVYLCFFEVLLILLWTLNNLRIDFDVRLIESHRNRLMQLMETATNLEIDVKVINHLNVLLMRSVVWSCAGQHAWRFRVRHFEWCSSVLILSLRNLLKQGLPHSWMTS